MVFRFCVAALCTLALTMPTIPRANAEDQQRHALSLIDTPKYPADYKHFGYVNPEAPKGGRARLAAIGSFDSLNPVLLRASRRPRCSWFTRP